MIRRHVWFYGLVVIYCGFNAAAFIGCNDQPQDSGNSWLDKAYPFIVGVLTPDSLRPYSQEIFVGIIIPDSDPPLAVLGQDLVTNRVIQTMRSWYFARIIGDSNAIVTVYDEDDSPNAFIHVGNGFYSNVDLTLNVRPLRRYRLEVLLNGVTYQGHTTIPGDFSITNIINGDTIQVMKSGTPGNPQYLVSIDWTRSDNAFFYRIASQKSTLSFLSIDHTFQIGDSKTAYVFSQDSIVFTTLYLDAIDSSYGAIYRAGDAFTFSDDWEIWFKDQNSLQLNMRSNLSATSGDVTGVFGSFTRAQVSFYARPAQ